MEAFLNMKNVQSEMDAKRKRARCKVPSMLMEPSAMDFEASEGSSVFSTFCATWVKEKSRRESLPPRCLQRER